MKMKRLAIFAAVLAVVGGVVLFCSRTSPKTIDARAKIVKDASVTTASVSAPTVAQVTRPATADEFFAALPTNQTASARGTKPFVLTSEQAFQKSLRLVAESMGARTVGVLSRHALLVEASPAARARLASDGRFKTADEFLPMRKVARELAAEVASGAETVQVAFLTLAPEDRLVVQRRVTAKGGEILAGCLNDGDTFRATMPAACVAELAACGDVRWMEKFERPHFMNDLAVEPAAMNVRAVWMSEALPEGLSGAGQIVTTSDTGIDSGNLATLHEDLRDRVLGIKVVSNPQCDTTDVNGHGTHTAGSIVGNGTKSGGQIRGTAWGANLYAWFCCGPGGHVYLPDTPDELFRNNGAWDAYIHSASWGSNSNGAYDSECRSYDGWTWENPEFLPVYSAGNEGRSGRCTIGSPAAAKNVLTVGSTQNLRSGSGHSGWWNTGNPKITAEYSSRGPCADGRIKPDIATPGSAILSTRSHGVNYSYGNYDEFYAYDFGTSMACPLMAGNVALVREWLMRREEFSDADGRRPTAALMKAIVTGGAKDAAKPNNEQGWGRADIKETLYPSGGRAVKLVDRIPFAEGEVFEYVVETTNSAPLDVQLVWVDFPGLVDGQPALVNDLDLTVEALEGGDGTVLYGNGGTAPDTLNNVESVRVASAAPDKYIITVTCSHITHDHTEGGAAALYVRGAFDPDYKPTDLDRVRIRRTGETYTTLDKALAEIQADDTVEILSPVRLRKAIEISTNCTIVATNADAAASAVTFLSEASLTVPEGVRVLFTNVVFGAEQAGTPVIHVASNGVAAVAGRAEVGEIQPEDEKGVEMAAPVESFVYVRCPVAQDLGQVFGFVTCDRVAAAACAAKILNAYEAEYGGEVTADGKLRWVRVPVDPAIASAYHTDDGGANRMYYLHLHKVFSEKNSGDVVVIRNCTLEAPAFVTGAMRLVCTNEGGSATITFATDTNATFYVEAGASLSVSNLVFTGATGDGAFVLNGGELTLESGTVIEDCLNTGDEYSSDYSGAGGVSVFSGRLTMKSGVVIDGCITDYGMGGGIFVGWEGEADLQGGVVTNCLAGLYGGGVGVYMSGSIQVAGDLSIWRNKASGWEDGRDVPDNLYLMAGNLMDQMTLTGELTGMIGLRCEAQMDDWLVGEQFGLIADSFVDETAVSNSAALFRSDDDPDKWHGAVATAADGSRILVWSDEVIPVPVPEPEDKAVRVIYVLDGGIATTNVYDTLDKAFASLQGDATVEICADHAELWMSNTVELAWSVVLKTEDNDDELISKINRPGNASIIVNKNASLCLTNVWLSGGSAVMVEVVGGELTMAAGSTVSGVKSSGSRDACGVSVYEGEFTMKDGAEVHGCTNGFVSVEMSQTAPAGGVIVEGKGAVFNMEGGTVRDCAGVLGGGVFIGNEARMNVSGAPRIYDNHLLAGGTVTETNANLSVSNESTDGRTGQLYLTGEFTGTIGVLEPRLYLSYDVQPGVDTNVFGRVDREAGDLTNLVSSAKLFYRDADSDVTGLVVTNADPEAEALLVWKSAVDEDGIYRDKDGNEYKVVEDPTPTPTEIDPPTAVTGLIYNGNEQTGVVAADGYTVTDNVAINAGDYTATVTLKDGYVWTGGSTDPLQIGWSIAKTTYDMSGVTFEGASFEADGSPKSIYISGDLPAGVSVSYEGNGQAAPGSYTVTAKFTGDQVNYEPIDDKTATLTITPKQDPDPDPQWDVITNNPGPLAFKAIERVNDTEWTLVITNRTPYCNYRLIWTTDLTKGFTSTGAWEHAVGPAAEPVWTTNVITTGGAWFWRAEGADGTNMVPHQAEGK